MMMPDQSRSLLALIVVGFILAVAIFQGQILPQTEQPSVQTVSDDLAAGLPVPLPEPSVAEAASLGGDTGLSEAEANLALREAAVAEAEAALQVREAQLQEQEAALVVIGSDLDARESQLLESEQALAERETALGRREERVGAESQALEEGWQRLAEQQAGLDALQSQLDGRRGELAEWEAQLLERERESEIVWLWSLVIAGAACLVAIGSLTWLVLEKRRKALGAVNPVRVAREATPPLTGQRCQPAVLRRIDRRDASAGVDGSEGANHPSNGG